MNLDPDDLLGALVRAATPSDPDARACWALLERAVEAGCHGYLLKEQGLDEYDDLARGWRRGGGVVSPRAPFVRSTQ